MNFAAFAPAKKMYAFVVTPLVAEALGIAPGTYYGKEDLPLSAQIASLLAEFAKTSRD